MATRTQIMSICDACLQGARPREREGVEVVISIGRRRTKRIALCETHRSKILAPLVQLLEGVRGERTEIR